MKKTRLFNLALLFVCVLFVQISIAQDYTRFSLPQGAKARLGKGWIFDIAYSPSMVQIAYSPDGTRLAVASSIGIWLYDAHTGAEVALLTRHTDRISSVAFSPDGETLASGGQEGTLLLWDVASGQLKATLEGHKGKVTFVAFSPNGKTLVSGGQDLIRIGNDSVITGLEPDTLLLWDVASGQILCTLGFVPWTAYSPDGGTLTTAGWNGIQLWDTGSRQLKATLAEHTDHVNSVAFSPDGKMLASGVWSDIQLWDVASGQLKATLEGHTHRLLSVAFSPDGRTLASGSYDKTIRLWDVDSGQLKATLAAHTDHVNSVAFSPDGATVVSGSLDSTIRLWDVDSGQLKATLAAHANGVWSVVISPDGRTLISSGNSYDDSWLWDMASQYGIWPAVNPKPP